MKPADLQQWLVDHGQPVAVDGKAGPATRSAILSAFTNTCAPAVTEPEIVALAQRLGCSVKQIKAVAKVESGGAAFDNNGRPKILFERHLFHRLTNGVYSVCPFSNPTSGGYSEDSWDKLTRAASKDAKAAFGAASWGRFQILGLHWLALGYSSAIDMAYSMVGSEAAHFEALARFVEANGLKDEIRALSTNPADCRAFAKAYNGPAFEKFRYHLKLADAMR